MTHTFLSVFSSATFPEYTYVKRSGYEADRVFDWKENILIFREPLFLFYLRWRRDE